MKKNLYLIGGLVFIGSLFSGCEPADDSIIVNEVDPVEVTVENGESTVKYQDLNSTYPKYFIEQLEKYETTTLNTYTLKFVSRVVKEGGSPTTTFNYEVTGNGATPQMDTFLFETPGCAGNLLSWLPQNSSNVQPGYIKWNSSISKTGVTTYSVTYAGNVPLGIISASGIRGGVEENTKILGPCKGVSKISGFVFIDADEDGEKEAGDFGLPGKNVTLLDEQDKPIITLQTSLDGSYSFMVIDGIYKISVSNDFLNDDYYGVGDGELGINVAGSVSNVSFGYSVKTDKIINDLENNLSLTTQPSKFWLQEIRSAGRKNAVFTKEAVIGLLTTIEGRLNDPFNFGTDKISSALSILSNPIKTPYDEFIQQLLTAELNIASGRGVQLDEQEREAFHEALLAYSEGVACRESNVCSGNRAQASSVETQTKAVSSRDTRMLSSFNGSGGI